MNIKLSPKQNAIIYCLQNDWELITSAYDRYVTCASKGYEFQFSIPLFYRLVRMGLIQQMLEPPFYYVLTDLGRKIKTKPVTIKY